MKQFSILTILLFIFAGVSPVVAQTTSATFKVWGNCGMCKTTIEGASKTNGATFASWDSKSKILSVKYDASKTTEDKIQKGIADAGYDNEKYAAPDNVYNNLHECCKYDRKSKTEVTEKKACCTKDGKCEGGKECCKKTAGKSDCCSKGTCEKEGGCCAKCEMKEGACCSKEGACSHDGKHGKCDKANCKDAKACKKGDHAACNEKGCCK